MNRSPGPTPCCAVDHQQRRIGVGQLLLDTPLHALGQRVARPLDPGQVDEHHLPPAARIGRDPADRPPRGLRAVGDDRDLGADDRVRQRRLADVGPAGEADEPGACHLLARGSASCHGAPAARASHRRPSRGRSRRGAGRRGRSPRPGRPCCSGQITTSPSSRGPGTAPVLVDREREHVRRLVEAAVLAVELTDPASSPTSSTDRWPSSTPAAAKGRPRGGTQLVRDVAEVESLRAQSRALFARSYSP